jgi:hypothetical protein
MIINKLRWLNFILLYLILFTYHFIVSKYPGDDFIFSKLSQKMTIIQWLNARYHEWSGRLFPDAMVFLLLHDKVWMWRIINPALLILLAYSIVKVWKKQVSFIEVLAALAIIGYFAQSTLSSGVFWITGSMNYLWPITLGIFTMTPYAETVLNQQSNLTTPKFMILMFLAILASLGNEQVALCMSCFAILIHITLFIKGRSQDKKLIVLTFLMLLGTFILLFAPGNQVRWEAETAYWFPGFDHLTLKDHLYLGTIWTFQKLFYDMKFQVLMISIITVIIYLREPHLRKLVFFRLFTICLGSVFIFHLTGSGLGLLYNFTEIKNFRFSQSLIMLPEINTQFLYAIFPYLFWFIFGILLVYLIINISKRKIFVLFCFAAAIATLMVMFFSPTIYASGNRVITVASVLLAVIAMGEIVESKLINKTFYLCIFGLFPLLNVSLMLYKWLINGFTPFL